jgi:cold-inducible RNA-binding protein
MSTKLYVGNLSFQTSSKDLQDLFDKAGSIESAQIVEDRDTGRSRGFAFVEMSSEEDAEAAIAQFNGREIGGRVLKVNEAKPRENRSSGRSGGGYRANQGGVGGRGFVKGHVQKQGVVARKTSEKRLHLKTGDQECVIEIEVDEQGQPIEGHVVIFSPAEEKQVSQYFNDIEGSRKRSKDMLKEIDSIKKKTQAILNRLS